MHTFLLIWKYTPWEKAFRQLHLGFAFVLGLVACCSPTILSSPPPVSESALTWKLWKGLSLSQSVEEGEKKLKNGRWMFFS